MVDLLLVITVFADLFMEADERFSFYFVDLVGDADKTLEECATAVNGLCWDTCTPAQAREIDRLMEMLGYGEDAGWVRRVRGVCTPDSIPAGGVLRSIVTVTFIAEGVGADEDVAAMAKLSI